MLDDETFIRALESTELPAAEFDHAAHVRAGWWYLRRYTLGEAIDRFARALRAFATANGAAGKYHETMTVAWMLVIADRLGVTPELGWPAFAAQHADLCGNKSFLLRYYSSAALESPHARERFVMPDRCAGAENERG